MDDSGSRGGVPMDDTETGTRLDEALDEALDEGPPEGERPMVRATRKVTARDFAIFQLKLVLDGVKDVVLFNVSILALALDLIAGAGKRPRAFYSLLRVSERFDLWLNLNGALERMGEGDDGLFGASAAGSDTLLGKLEELVRGGDEAGGGDREKESPLAAAHDSKR